MVHINTDAPVGVCAYWNAILTWITNQRSRDQRSCCSNEKSQRCPVNGLLQLEMLHIHICGQHTGYLYENAIWDPSVNHKLWNWVGKFKLWLLSFSETFTFVYKVLYILSLDSSSSIKQSVLSSVYIKRFTSAKIKLLSTIKAIYYSIAKSTKLSLMKKYVILQIRVIKSRLNS